jgi:hypothetical protein
VWAGYRFELAPISEQHGKHESLDRAFDGKPALRKIAYQLVEIPLPLSSLVKGLQGLRAHNATGHDGYLLGQFRTTGWWYFFPVVFAVKTPIGFLLLAGCGIIALGKNFRFRKRAQQLTLVFPAVIMLVCMSSRINLGVRHLLAIYPLLAILAAYAVCEFLHLARRTAPALAIIPVLLSSWVIAEGWSARPDYLAYFNEFAGAHPERILAESDLDWGQDLYRLSARLKELRVNHVSVLYFGVMPLELAGMPSFTLASDQVPTTRGYLAVSARFLTLANARDGSCNWLKGREPSEIIGKSIYLYNLGD